MMYDDVMMYLARLNGLRDDIPGASEVKIGNALVQLERWETPFGAPFTAPHCSFNVSP